MTVRDKVYLFCAVHFGWDKVKVDRQPIPYFKRLIAGFLMENEEQRQQMDKGMKSTIRKFRRR